MRTRADTSSSGSDLWQLDTSGGEELGLYRGIFRVSTSFSERLFSTDGVDG